MWRGVPLSIAVIVKVYEVTISLLGLWTSSTFVERAPVLLKENNPVAAESREKSRTALVLVSASVA